MKIHLLIATGDRDYASHLSQVLSDKHSEAFEVTVCSRTETLGEILSGQTFDVALVESDLLPATDLSKIKLPLILWDGADSGEAPELTHIRKYRRVSHISSDILEEYSKVAASLPAISGGEGKITAVWAPCGGVGKTTVALAYAAKRAAASSGITYLNLEHFSSVPVYFSEQGKSISTVFQSLGSNPEILLKAIALKDSESGITYFTRPDNYDDINELDAGDVSSLINVVVKNFGEVVIDMPVPCDEKFSAVMDKADNIFIVTDGSKASAAKLKQFMSQHNLFDKIRLKAALVTNKNAKFSGEGFSKAINLPLVSSSDPISVYKTLSGVSFE